jgi:hypothetical protein
MSVDQNSAAAGLMFVARPDNRMTLGWHELGFQADAREFLHKPVCALLQFFFVLVIGRNAGKPKE